MTRSNKTPKNPAKSTIKSQKCVTPQKATWRKWHNQPRLLARQAADERRYDRLLGRLDIIHHVTTTRSRFCVTFFVPTSVAVNLSPLTRSVNLLRQPILSQSPLTSYLICYPIRSALQSIPSIGASITYQPVIVIVYLVCDCACHYHVIRAFIAPVIV